MSVDVLIYFVLSQAAACARDVYDIPDIGNPALLLAVGISAWRRELFKPDLYFHPKGASDVMKHSSLKMLLTETEALKWHLSS